MAILQDPTAWLTLSFAIFVFVMFKTGRKAFTDMIDARINKIREELETSENLRVEAQELLAQYQRKHRDAVKEADAILDNAKSRAKELKAQSEQELKDLIARREAQLEQRITQMKHSAQADIRVYAADLAVKATRGIVTEKMDKKANNNLIDEAISALPKALKK